MIINPQPPPPLSFHEFPPLPTPNSIPPAPSSFSLETLEMWTQGIFSQGKLSWKLLNSIITSI